MSTKSRLLKIVSSLRDKAYRSLFVETQIEELIPFQIRAMRQRRGWTQKQLAGIAGMKQARISILENPNYEGAVNVKTLLKIANAFDVGLVVRFAPFSEVAEWSGTMSKASHSVPTFEMELNDLDKAVAEENGRIPGGQEVRMTLSVQAGSGDYNLKAVRDAVA